MAMRRYEIYFLVMKNISFIRCANTENIFNTQKQISNNIYCINIILAKTMFKEPTAHVPSQTRIREPENNLSCPNRQCSKQQQSVFKSLTSYD